MEEKNDRQWKVLESKYVIKRPWLTARVDKVQLPTGVVNDEYYVLEYPDWINVIAGSVSFSVSEASLQTS